MMELIAFKIILLFQIAMFIFFNISSIDCIERNLVFKEFNLTSNNGNINHIFTIEQKKNIKRRRNTKENLCETDCDCRQENSFITVNCDLYKNRQYIFGSRKYIPPTASSLSIKLAPGATLQLQENLFYENKVNRISIEGVPNGREHVEIRPSAFQGNLAPFPDITISNCHTIILRNNAFLGEFLLNISNSNEVIIYSNAFYNTSFNGNLNNILDLRIHEQAFNNAKAKLNIVSSRIENLFRFEASIREIKFFNCTIGSVNQGTFDVLNIHSIIFQYCKIDVFKTRAITEKLFSHHLAITGGIIGIIESEAIAGSGISELILSKNEIDTIQENAIYVTAINASITENKIKRTGHKWLRVKDWTNITISKNSFGEFDLIMLDKTVNPKYCAFESNFITHPKPGSLNITNSYCIIREISFYHKCSCNITWLSQLTSRDIRSESYCTIDETLKYCFNTTIFNVLKYEHEICDYSENQLDCMKNQVLKKIKGDFVSPEELEDNIGALTITYILISLFLMALCIVITIIIIFKCKRQVSSSIAISEVPTNTTHSGTALKDLKTFSDDDRKIINQTLQRMKDKYSPDIYNEVLNNTKILLLNNITEMQRVQTIGEIVQILGECQNPGEDFVAFTDILYKHLAPTGTPNIDPLYAEPGFLHSTSVIGNLDLPLGQTNVDHIYAEPSSLQQPLLTNEYASPADKTETVGLYSEPFSNIQDNCTIIPAYAIVNPKHIGFQQPSTSKNLPDVLTTPKLVSNIRETPENLANEKIFHITHSPNTNRIIPKYTIPQTKGRIVNDTIPSQIAYTSGTQKFSATTDSGSNHSGGSDITVKIDDIIDYADA